MCVARVLPGPPGHGEGGLRNYPRRSIWKVSGLCERGMTGRAGGSDGYSAALVFRKPHDPSTTINVAKQMGAVCSL